MAKRVARKQAQSAPDSGSRKVTYSLPERVLREVDRRSAGSERGKSRLVAEALAFYFAAQDTQALASVYTEAARDPQFQADNEAIQRDFAALDREAERAE